MDDVDETPALAALRKAGIEHGTITHVDALVADVTEEVAGSGG